MARGHLARGGQQLLVRHHFGDQAGPQRILGRQVVAGQAHPTGQADPDFLRQPHAEPPGRQQTYPRMGVGESRLLRSDQDVAVQRQLQAAGHCGAVDSADHRLAHRRPARRDVRQRRLSAQLFEVEPRAEHRIGAGEDDDVDGVVGLGVGQGAEELIPQRGRQRVAGLAAGSGSGSAPARRCRISKMSSVISATVVSPDVRRQPLRPPYR